MKTPLPKKVKISDIHFAETIADTKNAVNQIITYLEEQLEMEPPLMGQALLKSKLATYTIKKPEWWEKEDTMLAEWRAFREGYEAAGKVAGVTFLLED